MWLITGTACQRSPSSANHGRSDLVPVVAERLGLDTSREDALWRDRALVELTRAVQHSFRQAGVTITDHHTESRRFLTHLAKEEGAGRRCPVDWSWIVPPMSGAQTPVFHRYYDSTPQRPDFFLDDDAVRRARRRRPAPVQVTVLVPGLPPRAVGAPT